ncbi:MAG: 50S ribosomal protein L19 [Candidatus Omnitrophica bacterium CG11_big_fil_rev_8_21_14_0_20_63_9]|nr:MAG: 50S ribosomal protein L19 [Candidatus Omnitrophica bacterium CG11_big_fil_rev_8_21_14_0_20_63_9]
MDWRQLVHGTTPPPAAKFRPGDEVRVWYRILEQGGKERLGQFEGLVIRCRGSGPARSFTVRRVTHGEGVERVFPYDTKSISKIEVLRQGKVKRSRLYYLRDVIGKTRIAAAEDSGSAASAGASPAATPKLSATEPAEGAVVAADRSEPTRKT